MVASARGQTLKSEIQEVARRPEVRRRFCLIAVSSTALRASPQEVWLPCAVLTKVKIPSPSAWADVPRKRINRSTSAAQTTKMPRLARKTAILTCRITPQSKEQLALAAELERRSLAGMLEVMVFDWCKRHRISNKTAGKAERA